MKFYWIKTRTIIKKIFSNYIWDMPNAANKIYLTFDDGPTPEVTTWVLDELQKKSVKATFFCIGKNIEAQPSLFKRILSEGHAVGNHSFNHLNGWETDTEFYCKNVAFCAESILALKKEKTNLFRPPYGKIKSKQAKIIREKGYKIVMWDVLSADFDQTITKEKCVKNVIENLKTGGIVVFHDSEKAFENLKYALPRVLDFVEREKFKPEILE